MQQATSTQTNARKLARLIGYAQLVMAWVMAVLFSATPPNVSWRQARTRLCYFSANKLARIIRHLVIARAGEMMLRRRRPRRISPRNYAPAGFTRDIRRGAMLRAFAGSALRKSLKHRDLAARFAILAAAIRNIDALARRLVRHLKGRGCTRLYAMIALRPPHTRIEDTAHVAASVFVDTS